MKRTITIAICGVQSRIGTTTQAFQIIQYLQMLGYSTAYVELAEQMYIEKMRRLYKDVSIDGTCVIYDCIHMYRSVLDVNKEEDYDFLVKDYGSITEDSFQRVSYLEQDIHVICCGVKANEIFEVNDILRMAEFSEAKFVFSFVPPDQREGILQLMMERSANTFFANYNPDPFSYDASMNKNYRLMIGNYLSGMAPDTKRRKNPLLKQISRIIQRGNIR